MTKITDAMKKYPETLLIEENYDLLFWHPNITLEVLLYLNEHNKGINWFLVSSSENIPFDFILSTLGKYNWFPSQIMKRMDLTVEEREKLIDSDRVKNDGKEFIKTRKVWEETKIEIIKREKWKRQRDKEWLMELEFLPIYSPNCPWSKPCHKYVKYGLELEYSYNDKEYKFAF